MSAGIRAGSSNDGYIQVSGNDIITALSGGNVGIGNTSPSTKLHVNGTVTATNFAGAVTGTSSGNPTLTNGANNRIVTATGANALTGETNLQWDGETFYINRSSNTVEGLSISNSNNSQGSAGAQLNLSGGDNSYANIRLECNGTSHHIRQDGSGNLKFYNNTTDRVHITSAGKLSVKSAAENTVCISLLDNNSSNEIWRVGQAADGDGYVEVLEDGGTVGCKLDASGNSFTMGNFGIGVASPSQLLSLKSADPRIVLTETTNNSNCFLDYAAGGVLEISVDDNNVDANSKFQVRLDGATAKLTLDATGNLALGGTNTSGMSGHTNIFLGGMGNLYSETTAASGASLSVSNNAYINSSSNWVYRTGGKATNLYHYNGMLGVRTAATGSAGNTISWIEKFKINEGYAGTVEVKGVPAHLRLYSQRDTSDWDSTDPIGKLDFYVGDDSTNNLPYNAGFIHCLNETDNANEPSGALVFGTTTANLSGGAIERVRIAAGGQMRVNPPATNGGSTVLAQQALIGTKHIYTAYHNFSSTNSNMNITSIKTNSCGELWIIGGWANGNGLRMKKYTWVASGDTAITEQSNTFASRYGVGITINTPTMSISGDYVHFNFTFSDNQGSKLEKLKIHFEYFYQFKVDS